MITIGKLYVCFCADTEDNHPNYVPGWKKYGTNYDTKKVTPRFDWLVYFDVLSKTFKKHNFLVTWFLRVDSCINEKALLKFKPYLGKLKDDEIGIHIHTLVWKDSIWSQSLNLKEQEKIINNSFKLFNKILGFYPVSSRMGWNAMSNSIMKTLEKNNIKYDCSAVPNYYSEGFFKKRDNIIDWRNCPRKIYNPSYKDYKKIGKMNIKEIPISSISSKSIIYNNTYLKLFNLIPKKLSTWLLPVFISIIKKLNLNTHSNLTISPTWSTKSAKKIIDTYVKSVKAGNTEILSCYFHPSDIFNPKNRKINDDFINKIEDILNYLKNQDIEIIPSTISQAGDKN